MEKEKKSEGMMSVIAALGANILVAISKFVGYAVSGSAAMLNESIHSIVDCGNEILLLVGNRQSTAKISDKHPFGQEIKELNKDNLSLYRFLRESRHSEILIIFAEDSCAVVGLLIALGGTFLTHFTGNPFYDALSGVLIGVLLCAAALFLAREFYSLLIGESVTQKDLTRIKETFNRTEIDRLINVKTIHLGPTDILVTAKIDVKSEYEAQAPQLVNDIEKNLRAAFPDYKIYIYIETDKYKEDY